MIRHALVIALAAAFTGMMVASAGAEYMKSAAPPATEKKLTPQQQKMKDCGAQWQAMKKEGKTAGLTWTQYRKDCLKKP
jgi:hypothetical protein